MNPMSWESCVIHVLVAMILFPRYGHTLQFLIYSKLYRALHVMQFLGDGTRLCLGVGGIMFGVSVPYIGLSLTMGIVMGLAGSAGSLIPLSKLKMQLQPSFPYIIAGLVISQLELQ